MNCRDCESMYWKQMYLTAEKRFDKVQAKLILISIIMCVLMCICVFITALACIRTQRFIAEFEYVEETQIDIEQDSEGENLAVIGGEDVNVAWDRK